MIEDKHSSRVGLGAMLIVMLVTLAMPYVVGLYDKPVMTFTFFIKWEVGECETRTTAWTDQSFCVFYNAFAVGWTALIAMARQLSLADWGAGSLQLYGKFFPITEKNRVLVAELYAWMLIGMNGGLIAGCLAGRIKAVSAYDFGACLAVIVIASTFIPDYGRRKLEAAERGDGEMGPN